MGVLVDNPLLVLFLVVAAGAAVGRVRIRGVGLGPAAALFVGLAVSAWNADLADLPAIIPEFGLVLFIYTIGLASGPAFVAGIRRDGFRIVVGVLVLFALIGALVAAVGAAFDLDPGALSGLFAGSQTNTPALGAALEALGPEIDAGEVTDPVVGYSLAYPMGVLTMIAAAGVSLARARRPAGPAGAGMPSAPSLQRSTTVSRTVRVTLQDLPPVGELRHLHDQSLAFSRVLHDGEVRVATNQTRLEPGDLCTVIGSPEAVEHFASFAGETTDEHLTLDRRTIDFRRIVVSDSKLAGATLGALDLEGRYGATVTRVRRGDSDVVASPETALRLGDRLRVVGPTDRLGEIARELGDSDRSISEVDALGFATGLAIGLLAAQIAVPLPGGGQVLLGLGGGPLIVALVLGTRHRTGPFTWQIPYAANLTIRQLGVSLFLGGVGIRSGATFADSVGTGVGAKLAVAGVVVTLLTALAATAFIRILRRDPVEGAGMISGIQTQPAVLAFAAERAAGDERVDTGYALVFPLVMIVKLVIVQLLI